MPTPEPANPDYAGVVEALIGGMPIAGFLGLRFLRLAPGSAELEIPYRPELAFTAGAFQAGIVATLLDLAGGAAAATLLPPGWSTSTLDFTVKFIAPTRGERLIARACTVAPGRSLASSESRVWTATGAGERLCATGLVTMRHFEIK